ncbi:YqgE/AlgH family protein [Sulfitobacter sp. MF3-043]|uniref:YqgE/AlgH family protein n=1 Tax=Sulfitobacter sediminivivens TaxID=3252902 RepID=UPI0036DE532E
MTSTTLNLTGKLLVAMPGMGDPRFAHAVIFVTAHSDDGAMGLMVNKPAPDLKLSDVLDRLVEGTASVDGSLGVRIGGPVETGRGFVLHSGEYRSAIETLVIDDDFALTATLDVLEDIAGHNGPEKALLMLGYAGWGPGQLEAEIAQNGWLTCDAETGLVFDLPDAKKWSAALQSIGVDPLGLSAAAGRA